MQDAGICLVSASPGGTLEARLRPRRSRLVCRGTSAVACTTISTQCRLSRSLPQALDAELVLAWAALDVPVKNNLYSQPRHDARRSVWLTPAAPHWPLPLCKCRTAGPSWPEPPWGQELCPKAGSGHERTTGLHQQNGGSKHKPFSKPPVSSSLHVRDVEPDLSCASRVGLCKTLRQPWGQPPQLVETKQQLSRLQSLRAAVSAWHLKG